MRFSKEFTTVTTLSKVIAAILFITLPFIGFFAGIKYQSYVSRYLITETTTKNVSPRYPTSTPYPTKDSTTPKWKLFSTNSNSSKYEDKNYGYIFDIPKGYNVFENQNPNKDIAWSYDVIVMSDEVKKCFQPFVDGIGNPCGITDQQLSIVDIKLISMNLNTSLEEWIRSKHPSPPKYSGDVLEYIKPINTQYLARGISTHNKLGMGDGTYYWYFYNPKKRLMIEFSSRSNFDTNKDVLQVINSFALINK